MKFTKLTANLQEPENIENKKPYASNRNDNEAVSKAGKLLNVSGRSVADANEAKERQRAAGKVSGAARVESKDESTGKFTKLSANLHEPGTIDDVKPYASNQDDNKAVSKAGKLLNVSGRSVADANEAKERQRAAGRFDGKNEDGTPKLKTVQLVANLQQAEYAHP